jgi:hypothetical protein
VHERENNTRLEIGPSGLNTIFGGAPDPGLRPGLPENGPSGLNRKHGQAEPTKRGPEAHTTPRNPHSAPDADTTPTPPANFSPPPHHECPGCGDGESGPTNSALHPQAPTLYAPSPLWTGDVRPNKYDAATEVPDGPNTVALKRVNSESVQSVRSCCECRCGG